MKNLENALNELRTLNSKISTILKESTYEEYDDLSGLEINYNDGEQLFLLEELRVIFDKLDVANDRIKYLTEPVKAIGYLYKNSNGRYELDDKHYYTCGYTIEAMIYDEDYECKRWVKTSVEHDGKDYYLVRHKKIPMEGLMVRVR